MGKSQGSEVARVTKPSIMWMEGPVHEVRARARSMEKRDEIRVLWAHVRPGVIPYIELPRASARRRHAVWLGSAMVGLSGLGYLLWAARYILLMAAGVALLAGTWRFVRWLGGIGGGSSRITVIQSVDIRTK